MALFKNRRQKTGAARPYVPAASGGQKRCGRARCFAFGLILAVVSSVIGPCLLAIGTDLPVISKTHAALGDPCHVPGTPGTLMTGFERADGECTSPTSTGMTSDAALSLGELSSFLVHMFSPFIIFEAVMIGGLMGNEFVMGSGYATDEDVQDISTLLNSVWRVMRDLVNYGFILVLLAIAFMTVVTAGTGAVGGSSFNIKQILPKFVVAVVLVNFTWFGARVILDAANVTTHIVYGIPVSTGIPHQNNCVPRSTMGPLTEGQKYCPTYCKRITITAPDKGTTAVAAMDKFGMIECPKDAWDEFSWEKFNQNTIASLFAYSFFSIEQLAMNAAFTGSLVDITIHAIVALVIMLMLFTIFTALFFVFLERVVILWLNIIFSPVAVLLWVLKGAFGTSAPNNKYLGLNVFIKYAFLPATVGLPLVVGFILVNAGKNLQFPDVFPVEVVNLGTLIPGVSTIAELFWFLIAMAIMWTSMSIAQDTAQITGGVVKAIKQGAEGFGKFIIKSPVYAPWIPVKTASGEVKRGSLAMIPAMGMGAGSYWEKRLSTDIHELMGSKMDKELRRITGKMGEHEKEITAALEQLKKGGDFTTVMNQHFKGKIDAADLRRLESATGAEQEQIITELLNKVGRGGEDVKQFMGGSLPTFKMDIASTGKTVEFKADAKESEGDIARKLDEALQRIGHDKRNNALTAKEIQDMLINGGVRDRTKIENIIRMLREEDRYKYKIDD